MACKICEKLREIKGIDAKHPLPPGIRRGYYAHIVETLYEESDYRQSTTCRLFSFDLIHCPTCGDKLEEDGNGS